MDGFRILNFVQLEDATDDILLEDGSTTTGNSSTEGKVLTEDSQPTTTFDGAFLVQEDEAGKFSQGFKIKQEGVFSEVRTEGRLIQEDGTFLLLESQIVDESGPLGLENPLGYIQETVYMELEQAIGGDSTVRADKISHFVLEEDEDTIHTLKLEDGFDLVNENGQDAVLLEIQPKSALLKIRNED